MAVGALMGLGWPSGAVAHGGPGNPIASSYLARVQFAPSGIRAAVLGGDQRMWLRVPSRETVIVLDYQGTPYLRFSAAGVEVNRRSEMYWLNLPTPLIAPRGFRASPRPEWARASFGHVYAWHDGRLHALASVARSPGSGYVGRWTIPLVVDGRSSVIGGPFFHTGAPSIVWFWPAVVLVLCVLAGWRVRRPALDRWLARGLAAGILVALGVAGAGLELYGHPMVSAGQLVALGILSVFLAVTAGWLLVGRIGFGISLVIGVAAVGEAFAFFTTLLDGFVFVSVPAWLIRAVTVFCLGAGPSVLLVGFRLGDEASASEPAGPARAVELDELPLSR